jgi:Uma2 family endonuclease
MRILTAINVSKERKDYRSTARLASPVLNKNAACRLRQSLVCLGEMNLPYEEILSGETLPRSAPGARHEAICERLHKLMTASVANLPATQLLAPRSKIQVSRSTAICPDLALITVATGKLWLAAEIVSREDHQADTVVKKQLYEDIRVPRLWMIDPRYDNVEVYHCTEWGLVLKGILAGSEVLAEALIPEFQIAIAELFAAQPAAPK